MNNLTRQEKIAFIKSHAEPPQVDNDIYNLRKPWQKFGTVSSGICMCWCWFRDELVDSKIKSEIKAEKLRQEVNCMVEIYNFGSDYWRNLLEEGKKRHILSPMEMDLLNLAIAYADGKKYPSDKQAKLIWKIRNKLDQAGVLI